MSEHAPATTTPAMLAPSMRRDVEAMNAIAAELGTRATWDGAADLFDAIAAHVSATGRPHPGAAYPPGGYLRDMAVFSRDHQCPPDDRAARDWHTLNELATTMATPTWRAELLEQVADTVATTGRPHPGWAAHGRKYIDTLNAWAEGNAVPGLDAGDTRADAAPSWTTRFELDEALGTFGQSVEHDDARGQLEAATNLAARLGAYISELADDDLHTKPTPEQWLGWVAHNAAYEARYTFARARQAGREPDFEELIEHLGDYLNRVRERDPDLERPTVWLDTPLDPTAIPHAPGAPSFTPAPPAPGPGL